MNAIWKIIKNDVNKAVINNPPKNILNSVGWFEKLFKIVVKAENPNRKTDIEAII